LGAACFGAGVLGAILRGAGLRAAVLGAAVLGASCLMVADFAGAERLRVGALIGEGSLMCLGEKSG